MHTLDGIHIYLRAPSVVSSFQNAAKPRLLYNGFWVPVEEHLDVLGIESDSHARTVKDAISALEQAVYHTETPGPLPKSLADTLRALYVSCKHILCILRIHHGVDLICL